MSALIDAAMSGKQTEVDRLIAEGADLNARTPGGMTALHWAVVRGHYGVCKALVEKGADLKAKTPSGMTPLDEAIVRGRLNVVKLLADHGVNVVNEQNHWGDWPVHAAAREGWLPILKYLIEEKGVNIMVDNKKDQKRPLNIARESLHDRCNEPQHKECVHYLFDKDDTGNSTVDDQPNKYPTVDTAVGLHKDRTDIPEPEVLAPPLETKESKAAAAAAE